MMGEILYLITYLLTEVINESLMYVLFFGAKITKSKKRLILSMAALLLLHVSVLIGTEVRTASAVSMISMIIIPLFFFEVFKFSYLWIYPFVVLSSSILGISISYFLSLILQIPVSEIIQGSWYTVLCQSVPMAALTVTYMTMRIRKIHPLQINLGIKQYIVFYVVVISLFLMMAPIQNLADGDFNKQNINVIGAATSLGCITLVLVTIWQGISVRKEILSQEKSIMYEQSLHIQREYYESLLQQEEKMRRFRHDMNAHITALQVYAANGELQNLQNYLNKMISESAIYSVCKYTGNRIVDALIIQLKEEAERKDISVEIQGYLQEESAAKSYDLCIILSNLLKNAIEACEKIENPAERNISLKVNMYEQKIHIIIKNSVKEKVLLKGKYPKSTKDISAYHGLEDVVHGMLIAFFIYKYYC